MDARITKILKNVFGFDEFRPLQSEIITNVLNRRDTLVIMPTGGGKSLCYQIPALIFDGLTVVVSPLISLMKDQVEQLTELGVPAVVLNSSLSFDEIRLNMERVRRNEVKLLYVAPETLLTPRLMALLESVTVNCLTIDEAHCISEWGHDFRPEYRQLAAVRERFPSAVCIALTATATPRVREDIQSSLRFEASNEFIASFNRPNLFLEIKPKESAILQTIEFIRQYPDQSGIIYCFSRRQVDELTATLAGQGFSVRPYHAGLSDEERKQNQELFSRDDVQIIVATIAFGMGINKPNVRFIVHYDLPKNIESYYQEIGRAGRDGLRSHCLLLFSYGDTQKVKYFINQKEEHERQIALTHLSALLRYAETVGCRRIPLLNYFGENHQSETCEMCDNCLMREQRLMDLTTPAQMFLSCVKRSGEMFGAAHVIDILRGAENEKITRFNHTSLSTYGIGKDYSKTQWFQLSRQLLEQGFMTQDERYGSLKLTNRAYEFFKSKEPFMGVIEPDARPRDKAQKELVPGYDPGLFDVLKAKRKQLADEGRVPPYVIFSDKALVEMAAYRPMSESSFSEINGVGTVKLARYGPVFIPLIQDYCRQHDLSEQPKSGGTRTAAPRAAARPEQKRRHIQIGEAVNAGQSLAEVMAEFSLQQRTVIEHLERYQQEGHGLREAGYLSLVSVPPDLQQRALDAFEQFGTERLRPVFDALEEQVTFDDLRLLRLHYLCHRQ